MVEFFKNKSLISLQRQSGKKELGDIEHPLCFQAHQDRVGSWPWCGPWEDGLAEARFRYSLTTLTVPRRCLGMARRRVGRGGRSVEFLFL